MCSSDLPNTPAHGRCTVCLPGAGPAADKVTVTLPKDVPTAAGQSRHVEVPLDQVPVCRTLPASVPSESVRCVPGHA